MNQALELNRAFNVGDKVISLHYLHLWNDAFHYVHFLNDALHVVTAVTDEFFTFNPAVEIPAQFGLDTYAAHQIYQQSTGVCVGDKEKAVFSVLNDYALIKEALDSAFSIAMKDVDQEHLNNIVKPPESMYDTGVYLEEVRTRNMQYFAKKEFLMKRFKTVVSHLFSN
jgi:hypothetical protein